MKHFILSLVTVVIFQLSFGQSIKDYFIPDITKNVASFSNPNTQEISRKIYYKKSSSGYQIYDAQIIGGDLASSSTNSLTISSNQVMLITAIVWSAATGGREKHTYNPANIILKLPPIGQSISWFYYDGTDKEKCVASWTTVTYDGEQRKAIKLVEIIQELNVKMIKYYVKGVGLWKTDIDEGGNVKSFEEFNGLDYDPSY